MTPRVVSIASESNRVFRDLLECTSSKGIRKHGLFLVSGERAVADVLSMHADLVRDVILPQGHLGLGEAPAHAAHFAFAPLLFEQLDLFGTRAPLLALRTPELKEYDGAAPRGLEVFCALGDPSNVGALLRSCAAFGVSQIVLLRESASPFHPRAVRAASAATLSTPLVRGGSIHDLAGPLIALDMEGEALNKFAWPADARLLIGEEGPGVPNLTGLRRISIPMEKGVESLNATVAASLALYSYRTSKQN